jgi:hypothetical protein
MISAGNLPGNASFFVADYFPFTSDITIIPVYGLFARLDKHSVSCRCAEVPVGS